MIVVDILFLIFNLSASDVPTTHPPPQTTQPPEPTIHNGPPPAIDPPTHSRKRPTRTPGLVGTNAAYLVPEHIRKKFVDGWNTHVPLTYLTDKGCLVKDKPSTTTSQDILTIDNSTGNCSLLPNLFWTMGNSTYLLMSGTRPGAVYLTLLRSTFQTNFRCGRFIIPLSSTTIIERNSGPCTWRMILRLERDQSSSQSIPHNFLSAYGMT